MFLYGRGMRGTVASAIGEKFTHRVVRGLVVNVDEGAPDVGKDFYLVLKALAEVVRLPEGSARVHDYVDLNVIIRAALREDVFGVMRG